MASENGHSTTIVYLVKDAGADAALKNKYGYSASDIAHDFSIRQLFGTLRGEKIDSDEQISSSSSYGRQAFNGVLLHNDRVSKLKNLMHKFGEVEKKL